MEKTTRNKNTGSYVLYFFTRNMVPSKLEIKYKPGMYFSFNFGCYSIQHDIIH